jgi:outer membrane protein TolC
LADQNVMLYTLHTAQVNLSWSPDIFGGGQAKVRSARAAATAQAARRDLARSTIVANLVQSAIQYAALGEEIEATRDAVTAYRDVLALIKVGKAGRGGRFGRGGAGNRAGRDRRAMPGLERARKAQEAQIAVLIGVAPGTPCRLPRMDELTLPAQLPLSLPAQVVALRPDVRAAAAIMEGASADAKAAVAARLPSFTISANYGGTPTALPTCSPRAIRSGPCWAAYRRRCSTRAACCIRAMPPRPRLKPRRRNIDPARYRPLPMYPMR